MITPNKRKRFDSWSPTKSSKKRGFIIIPKDIDHDKKKVVCTKSPFSTTPKIDLELIKTENKNLRTEIDILRGNNLNHQKEKEDFQREIKKLQTEKEELQSLNKNLVKDREEFEVVNQKLKESGKSLQERNQKLKDELESLEKKHKTLQMQNIKKESLNEVCSNLYQICKTESQADGLRDLLEKISFNKYQDKLKNNLQIQTSNLSHDDRIQVEQSLRMLGTTI